MGKLAILVIFLFSIKAFADDKTICVIRTAQVQTSYSASLDECVIYGQNHARTDTRTKRRASVYHSDLQLNKKITIEIGTSNQVIVKIENDADQVLKPQEVNN